MPPPLISHTQRLPIAEARKVYERFVGIFPTAAHFWKIYLDHELKQHNYDEAKMIFTVGLGG